MNSAESGYRRHRFLIRACARQAASALSVFVPPWCRMSARVLTIVSELVLLFTIDQSSRRGAKRLWAADAHCGVSGNTCPKLQAGSGNQKLFHDLKQGWNWARAGIEQAQGTVGGCRSNSLCILPIQLDRWAPH